jgi:hypothetical protein
MKKMVDGIVMDMTADEIAETEATLAEHLAGADDRAAELIRAERDTKLTATDWTGMSDVRMSSSMKIYRQALRDVPAQAGFPNTIDWPEAP